MLLKPEEAWDRAMKAAAAFHELQVIELKMKQNEFALKSGIEEITKNYGSNYGIALLKAAFRVLFNSSLEEEVQLVRLMHSRIAHLQRLKEDLVFLKKKKSQVFFREVLPSWCYLLLRRSPEIRHLR